MRKRKKANKQGFLLRKRSQPGADPGVLLLPEDSAKPEIRLTQIDPKGIKEVVVTNLSELPTKIKSSPLNWVDIDGLGDVEVISKIGQIFGLHRLALEDVLSGYQRSKTENYNNHQFVVARMVSYDQHLQSEQFSLFFGNGFVVTFQEVPGDCLDPVRERLRKGHEKLTSSGADFLAYSLLDAVIDGYFPVLEKIGEQLEDLEKSIITKPRSILINELHQIKRELLQLRRAIWPLREAINSLIRDDSPLVTSETKVYLRDCYDHVAQIVDLLETYRELCADLMDVYLSSVSNKINEVMKVLTIMASIFIPLTFVVGVYGMNFKYLPELDWKYGYYAVWGLMLAIAGGLIYFFYRRGWLSNDDPKN